ncbi:glycine betaine ABC transporter substrate-binding protein [Burkholderia pseudomultivorans]|uniref:Glycine/betaine ABC transporter substrate-binding protein n=1 Tax=Burkholderia pseudomultivorans TaxID=1207504 RepID=A0A6P2LH65_9BURK|nr:glycine betaine ABC transporter substrate-binding protein [Burkholderia pseudomultivorans]MDR8730848.1 Osmoprotectant-binding protein OsmX [Burkholderia pseudomultivorans]MDR8738623.1 Osmoprotectant-binding protein OsmX [Burkholderia pseudomultivorans]MDR8745128.1 Osmoprotectant-binding protein OsmX [Burkholderia pseudomultivorans]MDR8757162.1 Osmoprotectant-binding protein OsmX [Burkholderia pseudomultivorans]MDR8781496.1 Osmoprotectant-binding protein OsmX [Burkholderia pseudomultivorans]
MTRRIAIRAIARLVAASALCVAASTSAFAAKLVLGAKNFTEQYVLAEVTAQYLRSRGYDVEVKSGLGSTLARSALENGQFDLMWDYTGTAALVYNKIQDKLSPDEMYRRVKALDVPRGLVWLRASPLNDTYALGLPSKVVEATGIRTISQLAAHLKTDPAAKRYVFGMDAEFANRPDGLKPLLETYDMHFSRAQMKQMDPGLVYTALHNNQLTIGLVYTTDGRVKGFGIVPLEDDKHYFPPYNATPVVRKDTLDRNPKLAAQLDALSAALDNDVMQAMNKAVDLDGKSPREVADAFLRTHPLP